MPILTAGLAMSRAMELDSYHTGAERARARLFPPSKWAGLFPSAAYRRSAPPQLALGRLKWRRLGCFGEAWMASQRKRPKGFPNHVSLWREPEGLSPDGGLRSTTNRKLNQTREPRDLPSSGGLYRPPGRKYYQTGEPWHLSCHGGKTPAKPHVSLHPCAPMARSPGSGALPLAQATRPSVEWRSVPANQREATPDRRAARPVAERR